MKPEPGARPLKTEHQNLPLFPLPRVVFPTEPVLLRIFEPRYREMVALCLAREKENRPHEFVIVRRDGGVLAPVGCTLRISCVLRRYSDGSIDLMATGLHRCRLDGVEKTHAYDTAMVELLPDVEGDWDEALATRAFALHRRLLAQFCETPPQDQEYSGQVALSWLMAPSAGLSLHDQQDLLELPSEDKRLHALIRHFTHLLSLIQDVQDIGQQVQAAWELRRVARNGTGAGGTATGPLT